MSGHPDVIVIFESFLHMIQKLQHIQRVQAAVQKSVHTLKRRFTKIQTVVHRVLERAHLHLQDPGGVTRVMPTPGQSWTSHTDLSDQLLPDLGLLIEEGQHRC